MLSRSFQVTVILSPPWSRTTPPLSSVGTSVASWARNLKSWLNVIRFENAAEATLAKVTCPTYHGFWAPPSCQSPTISVPPCLPGSGLYSLVKRAVFGSNAPADAPGDPAAPEPPGDAAEPEPAGPGCEAAGWLVEVPPDGDGLTAPPHAPTRIAAPASRPNRRLCINCPPTCLSDRPTAGVGPGGAGDKCPVSRGARQKRPKGCVRRGWRYYGDRPSVCQLAVSGHLSARS